MSEYRNQVLLGDVLEQLRLLPDNSIHCVITSPPYFGLRDYGISGQIGLEETPEQYIEKLVEVFREVRRVLRSDGNVWLNLGDSYWTGKGQSGMREEKLQRHRKECGKAISSPASHVGGSKKTAPKDRQHTVFKGKDLMMMPHRVAIALQADGWYVRNDVVWNKPNSMPESVRDRFARSHEYLFHLTKARRNWFDQDAVRVEASPESLKRINQTTFATQQGGPKDFGKTDVNANRSSRNTIENFAENPGRNMRTVLTVQVGSSLLRLRSKLPYTQHLRSVLLIATQSNPLNHFATFPQALCEPLLLSSCPTKVCSTCGRPYEMISRRGFQPQPDVSAERVGYRGKVDTSMGKGRFSTMPRGTSIVQERRSVPACECSAESQPGVVLDTFGGTGTVALVARRLGMDYTLIELNPEYHAMAVARLSQTDPFEDRITPIGVQLTLFQEA